MSAAHERKLVALARTQGGLLHERDLVAVCGRADELRRRLRSPLWQEVLPKVVAPALVAVGTDVVETATTLWAPGSWLSHFSAARRSGLWVPADNGVWLTVDIDDTHRSRRDVNVMRTRHPPESWGTDGFVRWMLPARTIVDLAAFLNERMLSAVLLSAVRKDLATAADVNAAAEPLSGRAGLALLARVTGLWTPERESLLEDALHADVLLAASGLVVERQYDVHDRAGRLLGRSDVAIPEVRLAFEADGLLFHSTDAQIAGDQRRDRQYMGVGWQTARFREGSFEDRPLVRRDVAAIIDARRRQLGAA